MALGIVKVLAGSFKRVQVAHRAVGPMFRKRLVPCIVVHTGKWGGKAYLSFDRVESVEPISRDNAGSVLGAAGWGLAGDLLLGPVGLLAGVVAGSRASKVTFVCTFRNGQKFLGETDSTTYNKFVAATWEP
jgi:hypothetical protein